MKYLNLSIVLSFFLMIASCKEPQPRKPITVKSGSFLQESVERTKKILEKEQELIQLYIKNDSINTYEGSEHGFWYTYLKKDSLDSPTPAFGNKIVYEYNVKDLNDRTIYSVQELGESTYFVDQENLVEGIRQALKIMKVGEEIKFIFPSQLVYGYKGDRNKIAPNMPLICNILLKQIEIKTEE